MIRNGWNRYLASPLFTSVEISSGAICSEKAAQTGHCGSPNSVTVTGALESPRTCPLCWMPLSSASTCATPRTFAGVVGVVPPPPPPPDWLITIRATTTAMAANPPMIRYWSRRFRATASVCCDSTACRSARRRSRSCCLRAMRGLYLGGPEITPGVGEGPRRGDRQRESHQNGARYTPLADGVDHEQLEIGQIGAEAEADQREQKAAKAPSVARHDRRDEQCHVADDPDHGDVDPGEMRVVALRDGLAAVPAGQALRSPSPALGDGDVGRDPDPDEGQDHGGDA